MELEYRLLSLTSSGLEEPKHLFETAFPPEERPPFDVTLGFERSLFYGVYRDGKFVALVDLVPYGDLLYIFFLAVQDERRNQGIGSTILHDVKKRYRGKRLFLLADDPEPNYPDYSLRMRRIAFYERNGFHLSGTHVKEMGVMYRILSAGDPVSKKEFLETMRYLIGEERFRLYYGDE